MATDAQVDAATLAYMKARGWSDEIIKQHDSTRLEIRYRMKAALEAAEKVR